MWDEEAFVKEVVRTSALSDFESQPEDFARLLWRGVERFGEDRFRQGRESAAL